MKLSLRTVAACALLSSTALALPPGTQPYEPPTLRASAEIAKPPSSTLGAGVRAGQTPASTPARPLVLQSNGSSSVRSAVGVPSAAKGTGETIDDKINRHPVLKWIVDGFARSATIRFGP
jgi:hypothetical protein